MSDMPRDPHDGLQWNALPHVVLGHTKVCAVGNFYAVGKEGGSAPAAYVADQGDAQLYAAAGDLYIALKALVTEIRAYSSPECDDEGEILAAELKAADAALAKVFDLKIDYGRPPQGQ